MKLKGIRIEKFRNIDNLYIDFNKGNHQFLLGINGEGKTNILEACFWGMYLGNNSKHNILNVSPNDENVLTKVAFKYEFNSKEVEEIGETLRKNVPRRTNELMKEYLINVEEIISELENVEITRISNSNSFSFNFNLKDNVQLTKIINWDKYLPKIYYETNFIKKFIPDDFSYKQSSEFKKLIVEIMGRDLFIDFDKLSPKMKTDLLNEISNKVTEYLFSDWKQGELKLKLTPNSSKQYFISINIEDINKKQWDYPTQMSTGLLWHIAFKLMSFNENIVDDDIILLDEPTNYLHIEAQENLGEYINNWYENNKVLIATHSPFILNGDSPKIFHSSIDKKWKYFDPEYDKNISYSLMPHYFSFISPKKLIDINNNKNNLDAYSIFVKSFTSETYKPIMTQVILLYMLMEELSSPLSNKGKKYKRILNFFRHNQEVSNDKNGKLFIEKFNKYSDNEKKEFLLKLIFDTLYEIYSPDDEYDSLSILEKLNN